MPRRAAKRRRSKKARKEEAPPVASDEVLPPPERFQHGDAIVEVRQSRGAKTGDRRPRRNETENKLDVYLRRGVISRRQHDAGMRLFREWRASGCHPRVVSGYAMRIDGVRNLTQHQAEMRLLVNAAWTAVGPLGYDVLFHVCCCNMWAKEWAILDGHGETLAQSTGRVFLKKALELLAKHYHERDTDKIINDARALQARLDRQYEECDP